MDFFGRLNRRTFTVLLGLLPGLAACTASKAPSAAATTGASAPISILLLGSNHLSQLYKANNPNSDVLTPRRQAEMASLCDQLQRYRPDGILVEELPENQGRIDSLYRLYRQDKLDLNTMPGGRNEVYQVGFVLAKRLGLPGVHCVNAPGGTSQSILHTGKNIELYEQATKEWRAFSPSIDQPLLAGTMTMAQYYRALNEPAIRQRLHTLVYRTPARVTDGTLKPDPMVDAAFLTPRYVGAEFISVLYNRDLKVYSNIVTTQMATHQQRQLLIMGLRHMGSLKGIFSTDPVYQVVEANAYLRR